MDRWTDIQTNGDRGRSQADRAESKGVSDRQRTKEILVKFKYVKIIACADIDNCNWHYQSFYDHK